MALPDVFDEAGMGGLPAQQVLGDGTGGRLVPGEQESEDAFVLLNGQGPRGQVQVTADGLGDVADGNALIADGVERRSALAASSHDLAAQVMIVKDFSDHSDKKPSRS